MRHVKPKERTKITSAVEEYPIVSCLNDGDGCLAAFFTDDERHAAAGRRAQSLAGICAVKRALRTLCGSLCPGRTFKEKSFTIGHKDNGAPIVSGFPDFTANNRTYTGEHFSISISHTRTTAYGMAVVEERTHGGNTD